MTYKCSKVARIRKHIGTMQPGTRFLARDVAKVLDLTTADVAHILLRLEDIVWQPKSCPSDNHWERIEAAGIEV